MKKLAIIILLCLCGVVQNYASLQYSVQHYSVENGLSQHTIMAIMQDSEGELWLGTWDGLNKFNGYDFVNVLDARLDAKNYNHRIDFIYEDGLGYIWFQDYNGWMARFDKRKNTIYQLDYQAEALSQYHHNTFLETKKGVLFIETEDGLLRVQENENTGAVETKLYKEIQDAHFVIADAAGAVWADCDNKLYRILPSGEQLIFPFSTDLHFTTAVLTHAQSESIWFGASNGQFFRFNLSNQSFEPLNLGVETSIEDMVEVDNKLIISTLTAGFFVYDKHNATLQQFSSVTHPAIKNDAFHEIYVDRYNTVWLLSDELGVWRYRLDDATANNLKRLVPPRDERFVKQIEANFLAFEDKENVLWLNPMGGGFSYYDRERDTLLFPEIELTNIIHTATIDRHGSLWLATYDNGLDRLTKQQNLFILNDLRESATTNGEARSFLALQNGGLLIGKKDGTIVSNSSYISEDRIFASLVTPACLQDKLVYTMLQDAKTGNIYYGTRQSGLYLCDLQGNLLAHYSSANGLIDNHIYALTQATDGTVYIATYGGGIAMIKDNQVVSLTHTLPYPEDQYRKVRDLLLVGDTTLYAATTNGLLTISLTRNTLRTTPMHDIHAILQTKDNAIWLGTFGGGLVCIQGTDTLRFTTQNGLSANIVMSMAEDDNGQLWFTSENALTRYDKQNNVFMRFQPLNGEKNAYFTEAKALVLLDQHKILFGYTNGYCAFTPEIVASVLHNDEVPPIRFETLFVTGEEQRIGAKGSMLEQSLNHTKELTLRHKQNSFSITYAAIDLLAADQIQYTFKLEGFDTDWNYVGSQRIATYTNLPAGTYHFLIRSTNADGIWVDNTRSITIIVKPSFWRTGWAWAIYITLIVLVLYVLFKVMRTYNRLHQQMAVEKQMADMKLRFFTNISHELRTPLTLITGPVENVLSTEKLVPNVRQQLEIVQSNANRMLRLINEILDFRKLQNKKLRLKIQLTHLADLVNKTAQNFQKEAADKHIEFVVQNEAPETEVWIDREKMDTILYNLLSNAFKFTPAGKKITIIVSEKPNYALVKVADEGVGIPLSKRNILFERFSSHDEIKNLSNRPGSGIGLNLVKELVDMHKGYIEVESEVGKGTTFMLMIRMGKDHFVGDNTVDFVLDDHSTIVDSSQLTVDSHSAQNVGVNQLSTLNSQLSAKKSLLIVEDNEDMRRFLASIFSKDFNVETAADGEEGWDKTMESIPDLVITDLMMPEIDGLQLTERIKTNEATNHIPVILLTARAAIESRLEAMNTGADDYITKPFSPEYLAARVKNILRQRELLQETYRRQLLSLRPDTPVQQSPNEVFLAKLMAFMEKNMDNNQLVVEDLVSEMALGRTVFFNKLKSLTGLSPVEFIRDVRIKRAAQLLEQGEYNITEITYMVGMNDSRYFSKCFKTVYDMTPTEYRKMHLHE